MMETATKTLREMLSEKNSHYVATDYFERLNNDCIDDIIERFDDCPEGLKDFYRSDWVNLCEPYTRDLLRRWDQQTPSIRSLFEDYCDAIGASSTVHALEGEIDSMEDGDDLNAAIVNHAMTYAAMEICREIYPDF